MPPEELLPRLEEQLRQQAEQKEQDEEALKSHKEEPVLIEEPQPKEPAAPEQEPTEPKDEAEPKDEGFPFGSGSRPTNGCYKTKLCLRFIAPGGCAFSDRCNFAHGESELRSRAPPSSISTGKGSSASLRCMVGDNTAGSSAVPPELLHVMTCPAKAIGRIMGHRGEIIQAIQRTSGSKVHIRTFPNAATCNVEITGQPAAIKATVDLVKLAMSAGRPAGSRAAAEAEGVPGVTLGLESMQLYPWAQQLAGANPWAYYPSAAPPWPGGGYPYFTTGAGPYGYAAGGYSPGYGGYPGLDPTMYGTWPATAFNGVYAYPGASQGQPITTNGDPQADCMAAARGG